MDFLIQQMFNSTSLYQLVHVARDCFSNMYIIGKITINRAIYTRKNKMHLT